MPATSAEMDKGLRRRLVTMSLNLKPGEIRRATGAHPVRVTSILNGDARLRPDEAKKLARVVRTRMRELFE